jgi:glycine cleavage system protein P-like pyridoxal-binding family
MEQPSSTGRRPSNLIIAARLDPHFPVLYRNAHGRVAHECIVDSRRLKDIFRDASR